MSADPKQIMRQRARLRRADLYETLGGAASTAVAACLMSAVAPGTRVAGYWPMSTELDLRPALNALDARGCSICLPVIVGEAEALEFRCWRPGQELAPGPRGTMQPSASAQAVIPDLILVPLLAFDRRGYRLGYGGGYYDRTLVAARSTRSVAAWGIAFAGQEIERIPEGPYDARIDAVIIEFGRVQFPSETG